MTRSRPFAIAPAIAACFGAAALLTPAPCLAQECPPGASGPCAQVQPGPGCGNPVCCAEVCAVILTCCSVTWDEVCAEVAVELCSLLACPTEGSCFEARDTTGCEDYACCAHVCGLDSWCCGVRWDEWCAVEAEQLCPRAACALTVPPGALDEIEPCTSRSNDGCNLLAAPAFSITACGTTVTGVCTTGAPRDTDWFTFTLTQPKTVTVTFAAEFPGEAMLVRGPCNATQVLARVGTSGCDSATLSQVLEAGPYWLVVSTATAPRSINNGVPCEDDDPETPPPFYGVRYYATLACGAPTVPADLNADGLVNGADLGLLLAAWGVGSDPADLNGSGAVDGADLGLLLAAWTG